MIIAATNKPNTLRADLRDRFHILYIPPLQKFDIPKLAYHFLKIPHKKYLKDEYLVELRNREYPGNVRELKRACEQLKAELGDKIFTSKSARKETTISFDYDRFENEYRAWLTYINPIITKFNLRTVNYKYMDYRVMDYRKGKYQEIENFESKILKLIPELLWGQPSGKDVMDFVRFMHAVYHESFLPQFLGYLHFIESEDPMKNILGYRFFLLNSNKSVVENSQHRDETKKKKRRGRPNSLTDEERHRRQEVIDKHGGNYTKAAQELEIRPTALYKSNPRLEKAPSKKST